MNLCFNIVELRAKLAMKAEENYNLKEEIDKLRKQIERVIIFCFIKLI